MKYLGSKIMYIGILIMLGFQVNAQQNIDWASPGATWIYGNWSNMDIQFYLKMTYVKDTIVFNQAVKKMELTKLSLLIPPNSEPIGSPNETYFGVEYMYESNDTVYRFNPFRGFSFDVLYVFNPIIGDTIQINKKENITHPCQTNSEYDLYEVDSVFTLNQGELWSAYRTKSVLGKWNFASAFPASHWDEPYIGSLIINGIGSLGSRDDRRARLEAFFIDESFDGGAGVVIQQVAPRLEVIATRKGIPCIWYRYKTDITWRNFHVEYSVNYGSNEVWTENDETKYAKNINRRHNDIIYEENNGDVIHWKVIKSYVSTTGLGTLSININENY